MPVQAHSWVVPKLLEAESSHDGQRFQEMGTLWSCSGPVIITGRPLSLSKVTSSS